MRPLLFLIGLLACSTSHAETLAALRLRVDTWLTNRFSLLNSRQNAYFVSHGKYFQGLITHSALPAQTTAATAVAAPDGLTFHHADRSETWQDFLPEINETLAGAIVIDVYDGPQGKGWIVTVYVRYNGTTYRRIKSVGPDTSRDAPWEVLGLDN